MTTNDNTSARAGLDLDAVEARARDNEDFRTYHLAQDSADDVPALLAEVRRLRGLLDAETAAHRGDLRDDAKALDDLVAQVWRAAGEEHEPPADVEAMLARVAQLRAVRDMAVTSDARREGAEAMREACAEVAAEHEAAARSRRSAFHHDDRGYDIADAAIDECEEVAAAIRALPLPEAPQ